MGGYRSERYKIKEWHMYYLIIMYAVVSTEIANLGLIINHPNRWTFKLADVCSGVIRDNSIWKPKLLYFL